MQPGKIDGATRSLGAPSNWDPATQGQCDPLPIRFEDENGRYLMHSAWVPSEAERAAIAAGQPIILTVWGNSHPPVSLSVQGVA